MKHLLVINGWSANKDFWIEFSKDASALFSDQIDAQITVQIIDIDQRKSLNEWLELIDQNITPQTLLIGWSLGGNLAIKYASISQKEFLGLLTLQTNPSFIARERWPNALAAAEFSELYDLVKHGDKKTIIRRFTHLLVSGSGQHKADRKQLKTCFSEATIKDSAILLSGLDLLRNLDVRGALTELKVPCLHLLGEKDALVPVNVKSDIEALFLSQDAPCQPHKVEVLAEMAHLPCWAHRSEILIRIKEFVKTI